MTKLFWTESVSFKQKHYKRVFPVQGVESTESSVKVKRKINTQSFVLCYFPPVVVVYSSAVIWKTLPWQVVKSLCSLLHEYHFANGRIMHLYLGASKMGNNANHQFGTIQIQIDDIKAWLACKCEVVQKRMVHIRNTYKLTVKKMVRLQRKNFPWVCLVLCLHLSQTECCDNVAVELHSAALDSPTHLTHTANTTPAGPSVSCCVPLRRLMACYAPASLHFADIFAEMRWVLMHTDGPCWPLLPCSPQLFSPPFCVFSFYSTPLNLKLGVAVSETGIMWWVMSFVAQDNVTFKNTR